ncbi:DsbA family protein [Sulfurovum sp. zt1-1]|uniref:DsbA family protein n=1 Tax=Sulfurovum zhangzhouensis TaxID=3019067 RepID=A0ABT7QXF1_9BACT|nr:DsbA family protein [Sulfurovum zhangzhouensis]MDM5271508.1 DsbA family protein [Sulfurovum zhangzhouensis]
MKPINKTQYIFVIDPMCSWCWGFHPVIERLRREYEGIYTFSLVVGGLRTKGAMLWDEPTKNKLKATWQQVADTTGQYFTDNLFKLDYFEYDTYPACKAVVAVRELWGDDASFEYLSKIQRAFYVDGLDITHLHSLVSFIEPDRQKDFTTFFESERAEVLLRHDFSKARSMGANAFPSVVKIDSDGHMMCKKGFQRFDEIIIDT